MTKLAENNPQGTANIADDRVLGDVNGGISLIGKPIEIWINGKYGRFFRTGKIVNYKKNKSKGKGKLSITKGLYLIDLGNIKLWRTRSDFNIT